MSQIQEIILEPSSPVYTGTLLKLRVKALVDIYNKLTATGTNQVEINSLINQNYNSPNYNITGNTTQKTTTGKNKLVPQPSHTTTSYGITIESNGKGKYVINGTSTGAGFMASYSITNYTIQNTDYIHLFNSVVSDKIGFILTCGDGTDITVPPSTYGKILALSNYAGKIITSIRFYVNSGYTFNNLIITPMICNSSTATPYEEYTGGQSSPSPDYKQDIVAVGDNNFFRNEFRQGSYNVTTITTRIYSKNNYYVNAGTRYKIKANINLSTFQYVVGVSPTEFPSNTLTFDSGWQTGDTYEFTPAQSGYVAIGVKKSSDSNIVPTDMPEKAFTLGFANDKYLIPIKNTGKNIGNSAQLYNEMYNLVSQQVSEEVVDNKNCIKFNNYSFNAKELLQLNYKENTIYTIKFDARVYDTTIASGYNLFLFIKYTDNTTKSTNISARGNVWQEVRLVSDTNKTIKSIYFSYGNATMWLIDKNSFYIGDGDITSYEPYREDKYEVMLDRPLYKIGTVADEIEYLTKKRKTNFNKVILRSVDLVTFTNLGTYTRCQIAIPYLGETNPTTSYCNIALYKANYSEQSVHHYVASSSTNAYVYLFLPNSVLSAVTLAGIQEFISNNKIEIVYKAVSLIEETIDMPDILLHEGTNIISIDTELAPSEFSVTYYKDGRLE